MLKRIIDHLVPPFFADDEEKTRIASLLNVIVLSSLAGAVFYLAFAQFERIPYIVLAIAVILSVWQLMKRGYVRVASIAMVMGLLAVFVVVIFTGGGLRAPAYSGLVIVILSAGLILGWRSAVSMTIFSVLYGIFLLVVDSLGMSPQTTTYTNIALWIIESIFFIMAGVLLTLALQTIEDAFRRANNELAERKRSDEKIQRQNQRLKALREIDTAILSADSVENIVGAALTHIRELIDCRRAAMALIDEETNEVVVFDVKGAGQTSVSKGTRIPLMLFGDMFQPLSKNQPVLIKDLAELPDLPPLFQTLRREGLRSICVLPLFSQGSQFGTFSLSSEIPGFFDEERIGLGREVANQVAIAITQSRLIDVLKQRAREREDLIAELTAKNAELENFTYTVSHDLKSPLVTMKGFLGYLEQDTEAGNVERLKSDIQRIASAVDKMHELLGDLLELSRIGRFVNPSVLVPFEEIVREALELVHGRIKDAGVTVQLQPNLPIVYGDRQRLIEILQNLLDNSAKYMGDQPDPRIEIGQRGEDAERGQHLFYVKDNGIGIAPEYREQVFGLFNKLDARSEGTGIGLALVKRIVEFHRGRIWVESEGRRGAAFYFTLPGDPLLR